MSVTSTGWVLSLHLLSAFALLGGLTLFLVVLGVARRTDQPAAAVALGRVSRIGTIAVRAGLVGTLVFGVWLVFIVNGYALSDGWILAALVLWAVAGAAGDRSVVLYRRATTLAGELTGRGEERPSVELRSTQRSSSLLAFRLAAFVATVVILALMIWKLGA